MVCFRRISPASASVLRLFDRRRMDGRPNVDVSTMAPKSSSAAKDPDVHKVERLSTPYSTNAAAFGSDVVAETLSALDIPYIALNPGASYRGQIGRASCRERV